LFKSFVNKSYSKNNFNKNGFCHFFLVVKFILSTKISIFDQSLFFWPKYQLLTKISLKITVKNSQNLFKNYYKNNFIKNPFSPFFHVGRFIKILTNFKSIFAFTSKKIIFFQRSKFFSNNFLHIFFCLSDNFEKLLLFFWIKVPFLRVGQFVSKMQISQKYFF